MIRNWTAAAAGALRTTPAPVTRTLIVLCCLVFLIGPASGLHPAYGSGEELLSAQRDWFRRWGVIPADLFDGSPRPPSPRPRRSSCTAAGFICWATCCSSMCSGR